MICNMFWIYALYNNVVKKIYIGQTSDIEKRIKQHNLKLGNHYTARFQGRWELIYKESVATRSESIKREKQLKTARGRQFIKEFIPE